ncbi:MAG: hypothetical protein EBR33_10045 [Synechococcaceae bacterium WB4_1_0192]|jgi:ATP-binding cassette, subfamily C, bacterial LapB|nr:hypothetical protein [Synechococcaceae bacterium WB4_1_0192]
MDQLREEQQLALRFNDIRRRLSRSTGAPDLSSPVVRTVIAATLAINLLVLAVPLYINRIYTSVLPQQAGDSLVVITLLLLAVMVLDVVLKTGRAWVLGWLSAGEEHRLRLRAIRSLLAAPLNASESASVQTRLEQVRAAVPLRNLLEQQWLIRRIDLPFVGVYLLVLALVGGWLVLIPMLLAPLFIHQATRAADRMALALHRQQRSESFRDEVTIACLQSAPTIKALGLEGFLVRRLEPSQETLGQATVELESSTARLQNLSQLFAQWSQLLIVSLGGWLVINQQLSSGALAACTLLSGQITMPLSKLFGAEAQVAGLDLARNRLDALLDLPTEAQLLCGDPVPHRGELSVGGLRLPTGAIALVSGGVAHQSAAWLDSLTGLRGAIPDDLRYAGSDVQTMERVDLRRRLRLVRHGRPLLRGTVLDHLCQFQANQRGEQAVALCERHGVAAQIHALPRGYDSPMGEDRDFPLTPSLVFRLQVIQALMDDPAVLMVDASEVNLPLEQLSWLLSLEVDATRLIALESEPALNWPPGSRHLVWQGDRLMEVQR